MEDVGNPMVISVVKYWLVSKRARRICTREYVGIKRRCALVKSILKLHRTGIVTKRYT